MKTNGSFLGVVVLLVGCGGGPSDLELAFISGHLGDYRGCPEKAAEAKKAPEADPEGFVDPDREGCTYCECNPGAVECQDPPPMPAGCVDPMISFTVTNLSQDPLNIPSVESMRLLLDGAEPAVLPLLRVAIGDASIEELAGGAVLRMQASFQGPYMVEADGHPRVELNVASPDTAPAGLTTPELKPLGL